MSDRRSGDAESSNYFRSNDRVVRGDDGWYYVLRDAEQLGPFSNRDSAEYRGTDYVNQMQLLASFSKSDKQKPEPEKQAPVHPQKPVRLRVVRTDSIKRKPERTSGKDVARAENTDAESGLLKHFESAELSFPHGYQWAASGLIANTRRIIRIFSSDLKHEIYSDKDLAKGILNMLRHNSGASVRVMVTPEADLSSAHHLLNVAKRVPSLCQVRVLKSLPERFQEDYILSDRQGLLTQKSEDKTLAWLNTNAEDLVGDRIVYFDRHWSSASGASDPDEVAV